MGMSRTFYILSGCQAQLMPAATAATSATSNPLQTISSLHREPLSDIEQKVEEIRGVRQPKDHAQRRSWDSPLCSSRRPCKMTRISHGTRDNSKMS